MSWDCGLERQAQEYGLALHRAYVGGDFVFGALARMTPGDATGLVVITQFQP
jgi:hypothetical protein